VRGLVLPPHGPFRRTTSSITAKVTSPSTGVRLTETVVPGGVWVRVLASRLATTYARPAASPVTVTSSSGAVSCQRWHSIEDLGYGVTYRLIAEATNRAGDHTRRQVTITTIHPEQQVPAPLIGPPPRGQLHAARAPAPRWHAECRWDEVRATRGHRPRQTSPLTAVRTGTITQSHFVRDHHGPLVVRSLRTARRICHTE
jgi:hypothetical protein